MQVILAYNLATFADKKVIYALYVLYNVNIIHFDSERKKIEKKTKVIFNLFYFIFYIQKYIFMIF